MSKFFTIATCVAVLFLNACKQEPAELKPVSSNSSSRIANQNAETITDQPYTVQLEYTQDHLKTLGKAALKLANKSHFRTLVYEEASKKKWQQETSVLFSTLFTEGDKKQLGVRKDMEESVGAEALKKSINAFAGIEGKVLYPTIYIPSYEKRAATINKAVSSAADLKAPIVVIYVEDKDLLPAYKLDAHGNLVEAGFMVDEAYATENEVWVISINETAESDLASVKKCGDYPCEPPQPAKAAREAQTSDAINACADGNTTSAHLLSGGINVYVGEMEIREHKESWAGANSEVQMMVSTVWGNGYSVYNGAYDGTPFYEWSALTRVIVRDFNLRDFSRDDVKNRRRISLNVPIALRWGGMVNVSGYTAKDDRRDHMIYCVYEDDAFPHPTVKPTWTTYWNGGSLTRSIELDGARSNDSPYVIDNVNWYKTDANYACFATVDYPYLVQENYRGNPSIVYSFYTTGN